MSDENYVTFEIDGINHDRSENNFVFDQDAECQISDDPFIKKIIIASDISSATFYLHDSIQITNEVSLQIIEYLENYLGNLMVSLVKNSLLYSSVQLQPTIFLSTVHFLETNDYKIVDHITLQDSASCHILLSDVNNILKTWIQEVDIQKYTDKSDKYDILFLLLQGENIVQKYMAMYAYLMSLVKEIYSKPREGQKQVVQYVTENHSRVGQPLCLSQSTRPGASETDKEDQFTSLRNMIGHPSTLYKNNPVTENAVNGLASIICCAIEDVPV